MRHHRLRALARGIPCTFLALLAISACGGGGGVDLVVPPQPPTVSVTSGTGATSIVSGSTLALVVQVRDGRGQVVSAPSVSWSSSNAAVLSVSQSGVVTGAITGRATITASSLGVSGGLEITVTPGQPTQLAMRAQPGGARAGAPFTTAASVEVRDAAGNVVSNPSVPVAAALASGGGTLRGTTTLVTSAGVATFADLAVDGAMGARTLSFTSPGLTAATTTAFSVDAGAAAVLAIRTQPAGAEAGRALLTQPVIEVQDAFGNVVAGSTASVRASVQGGGTVSGTTSVTPVNGIATFTTLAIGGVIGTRSLVFDATGLQSATSQSFALQPGPAAQLAVIRAAAGAGLNGPFTTQPILEVRDAFDNVSTAAIAITAGITAGGGTLTGATVTATAGRATFTSLGITGAPGARTIAFTAPQITPATFAITPCDAIRGPVLGVAAAARPLRATRLGAAVTDTVRLIDTAGSCAPISSVTASVAYTGTGGWLTVAPVTGTSSAVLTATPGALAIGAYTATATISAAGATPVLVPVSFSVIPRVTVIYGSAAQKALERVTGVGTRIVATAVDELGTDVSGTIQYRSRSPSIASIAADGTITPALPGQAWLVASEPGGGLDSLFLNVVPTTGPILRLDVTTFRFAQGTNIVANVVLDMRGATAGAGQIVVTWPTTSSTPSLISLTSATALAPFNPVIASDVIDGTTRISFASVSGLSGVVPIARLQFLAVNRGSSQLVLRAVDLVDLSSASLLTRLSTLQYPLVIP